MTAWRESVLILNRCWYCLFKRLVFLFIVNHFSIFFLLLYYPIVLFFFHFMSSIWTAFLLHHQSRFCCCCCQSQVFIWADFSWDREKRRNCRNSAHQPRISGEHMKNDLAHMSIEKPRYGTRERCSMLKHQLPALKHILEDWDTRATRKKSS